MWLLFERLRVFFARPDVFRATSAWRWLDSRTPHFVKPGSGEHKVCAEWYGFSIPQWSISPGQAKRRPRFSRCDKPPASAINSSAIKKPTDRKTKLRKAYSMPLKIYPRWTRGRLMCFLHSLRSSHVLSKQRYYHRKSCASNTSHCKAHTLDTIPLYQRNFAPTDENVTEKALARFHAVTDVS